MTYETLQYNLLVSPIILTPVSPRQPLIQEDVKLQRHVLLYNRRTR